MHSPRLAEAYCDRMHEAAQKQNGQHKKALWGSHAENSSYEMYLALIKASIQVCIPILTASESLRKCLPN